MSGIENTAARYRARAEGLRALAQAFVYSEHRTVLLSIAANYEQLAMTIERAAIFQKKSGRHSKRLVPAAP